MDYKSILSEEEIREYAKKHIDDFREGEISIDEIGDGNINYVFKVTSKGGESLIFKKAEKLLRTSGRPLDQKRIEIEQEYLKIADSYVKDKVPKIYEFDKGNSLIIMEDISDFKNLRTELINGNIYKNMSKWVIEFLIPILSNTSDIVDDAENKKEKMRFFINPEMCKISEDLVLTEPYNDYKNRNIVYKGEEDFVREYIYEDMTLRKEVNELKINFMNNSQVLLHGDLHSGSIFVNESGLRVIDSEFAFYGPAGYDIGNVLAHYVISYITSSVENNKTMQFMDILISETKYLYDKVFKKLLVALIEKANAFYTVEYLRKYVNSIKSDTLGYMGTEIIRRVVGDTKTKEIEEVSEFNRIESDKALIKFGKYCILNRGEDIKGDDLVDYIKFLL
ncbi:S-methyl-5-thioribose kinase [Anaerosphaera multitolerans]|uniref:S-methyl-5-thioribose kinase n=1 Tax=Anaerosphaera multitolerans TaxID=2487351 RepID=A0A437S5B8_9FIRM|nr:S-methyl-5-thioribose kinase [Anaerosphaera multitolerans]RVU54210.1 S-methyl-5-thioribose kinase [Anaerosphaera multitolerans]